jgi:hypothetical protein
MRLRRLVPRLAVAAFVLAGACSQLPVTEDVVIEFREASDEVVVTAQTSFDLKPPNEAMRRRAETARAAAAANTDPWAVRFARLRPISDSTSMQRDHGVLERVTRSVTIAPEDLQLVFADTNITVRTARGDGWREVSFYPGSGGRATREQQREFNDELDAWSISIGRYFRSMREVYSYLDRRPQRAQYIFAAIIDERGPDDSDPVVLEEEQPMVDEVRASMTAIAERMDATEGRAMTFSEEADLMFNPFPARLTVKVPGTILSREGFKSSTEKEVVVERVDLLAALASLEGKWLTPDPLALMLREEAPNAAQLAAVERHAETSVASSDVARYVRSQLERSRSYSVRWRE